MTDVGAPGVLAVVIEFDADEAFDTPNAFVDVTVNVYDVLDVNPVTDIGDVEALLEATKL